MVQADTPGDLPLDRLVDQFVVKITDLWVIEDVDIRNQAGIQFPGIKVHHRKPGVVNVIIDGIKVTVEHVGDQAVFGGKIVGHISLGNP